MAEVLETFDGEERNELASLLERLVRAVDHVAAVTGRPTP
jgi:hypothetical protein